MPDDSDQPQNEPAPEASTPGAENIVPFKLPGPEIATMSREELLRELGMVIEWYKEQRRAAELGLEALKIIQQINVLVSEALKSHPETLEKINQQVEMPLARMAELLARIKPPPSDG